MRHKEMQCELVDRLFFGEEFCHGTLGCLAVSPVVPQYDFEFTKATSVFLKT